MMDIVFGDSAAGSLLMARNFGIGQYENYSESTISVFVSREDGREPTQEELNTALQKMQERHRKEWENAVPLDIKSNDILGFELILSVGDIAEDIPADGRRSVIEKLWGVHGEFAAQASQEAVESIMDSMNTMRSRAAAGEDIRIWCGRWPDEVCGLHWFLWMLLQQSNPTGRIFLVELPAWREDIDGQTVPLNGSGEVGPGDWGRYVHLQRELSLQECEAYAAHWQALRQENAPLRAVLNGRLVSVPETFYDSFIYKEIARQQDEFEETLVVGGVLGKYELGIGDTWVALRIEEMIRAGELQPLTEPPKDKPIYWRMLRKCK